MSIQASSPAATVPLDQLLAFVKSHEIPYIVVSTGSELLVQEANTFALALLGVEAVQIQGVPLFEILEAGAERSAGFQDFEYRGAERIIAGEINFLDAGETKIAVLRERKPAEGIHRDDLMSAPGARRTIADYEETIALLSATFNVSPDGHLVVDNQFRIRFSNDRFREMFGMSAEFIETEGPDIVLDFVAAQMRDPAGFFTTIRSNRKRDAISEDTLELKDGRIIQRTSLPFKKGDEILGRVVNFRDITDLRSETKSLEAILGNMPFDVALLDINHRYRFVNPSAIRDPDTSAWIIGRDNFEYARRRGLPVEFAERRRRMLEDVIRRKTPIEFEEVNPGPGGQRHIYQRRLVPIFDARGEVTRILGTGIEITGSVRYREELEARVAERTADLISALEKERELGAMKLQFVSMASHEFRTPLATITTACDILLNYRERLSEEQISRNLRNIHKELQLLTELLNDFLSYGKAEAGRLQFHPDWTDLHKILEDGALRTLDPRRGRRVSIRSFPRNFRVFADHALLRQVLNNLTENALKYSKEDSSVRVVALGNREVVRIRVRDRGIGIDPSELGQIFDPFFRGRNVGNRSGTGLGLAISKMSLELHGGRITARSEPDRGTVIEIVLPLRVPENDANSEEAP